MRTTWLCLACSVFASMSHPQESIASTDSDASAIRCLVEAYPGFLESSEHADMVRWKDGTEWPFDDHVNKRDFDELLSRPCLKDQLSIPYPAGWPFAVPGANSDPGRIRYEPFFRKMYGDTPEAVKKQLVNVSWLPGGEGKTVSFTKVNGAAEALSRVAQEIDRLPADTRRYAATPIGTFKWRPIAETQRLSMHSFGAAIDLELPKECQDYWEWHDKAARAHPTYPREGEAPAEPEGSRAETRLGRSLALPKQALTDDKLGRIVCIFEKHGFIWGGKWYHFDTMHFEYRPELLAASTANGPER